MSNEINVREILGVQERPPALFFDPVGPDRYEAMKRKQITEQTLEEWYRKINATNTRALPKDLVQLYEAATVNLCQILHMEEEIIKGGAK